MKYVSGIMTLATVGVLAAKYVQVLLDLGNVETITVGILIGASIGIAVGLINREVK